MMGKIKKICKAFYFKEWTVQKRLKKEEENYD